MQGAKFHGCRLAQAEFEGVDLSESKFTNVNLQGAKLANVNLANGYLALHFNSEVHVSCYNSLALHRGTNTSRTAAVLLGKKTEPIETKHRRPPGKKAERVPKAEKLVCRYCGNDDLAPSFIKRRDRRCRKCFSKRYGSKTKKAKLNR